MLFIHKETGEICEAFIKSLGEVKIKTQENKELFEIAEVAFVGNIQDGLHSNDEVSKDFIFLGFL